MGGMALRLEAQIDSPNDSRLHIHTLPPQGWDWGDGEFTNLRAYLHRMTGRAAWRGSASWDGESRCSLCCCSSCIVMRSPVQCLPYPLDSTRCAARRRRQHFRRPRGHGQPPPPRAGAC